MPCVPVLSVYSKTGLLTINNILSIQSGIEENRAGFRKLPGTALKNDQTGETIYTPPQHPDDITALRAIWSDSSTSPICATGTRLPKWPSSTTSLKAFTRFTTATAAPGA
jgi:hypothetical protein